MAPSLVLQACRDAGERLRCARKQRGLTQQQLADLAGIGLQTLIRMEKGHAGVSSLNVQKVRHALQLTARESAYMESELAQGPEIPLHEKHLDSEESQSALEAAARAACEVLDAWLDVKHVEVEGITSNFQGLLKEHLAAMICGRPHARVQYALPRLVYSDDWLSETQAEGTPFGWVIRISGSDQVLVGRRVLALSHEDMDPYTSPEAAYNAFRKYVERDGHPDYPVEVSPLYLIGDTYSFKPAAT